MSDSAANTPPIGERKQAEKYIDQLIQAVHSHTFTLTHSDLSKFDPCSIQDHYRLDLGTYHAEVSHSIHPETKQNLYALIFTSIAKIQSGQSNNAVLSYTPLTPELFEKFKAAGESYFAELKRREEQKRFKEAMKPIDQILSDFSTQNPETNNQKQEFKKTPTSQDWQDRQVENSKPEPQSNTPSQDQNRSEQSEKQDISVDTQEDKAAQSENNTAQKDTFFHNFKLDQTNPFSNQS